MCLGCKGYMLLQSNIATPMYLLQSSPPDTLCSAFIQGTNGRTRPILFPVLPKEVKWRRLVRDRVETSPLPSWKPKVVFPLRGAFFSALLLIIQGFIAKDKPYHAPFRARLNMPSCLRYLFRLDVWHNGKVWEAAVAVSHTPFSPSGFQWSWLS